MSSKINQILTLEVPNEYNHKEMSQHLKSAIIDCPRCNGSGIIYVGSYDLDSKDKDPTCPFCKGLRKLQADINIDWKPAQL